MNLEELKTNLNRAISDLYENQPELMENHCKEESVCAHLVCCLKPLFAPWSVDLEYNRDGQDPKRDQLGEIIYPDIIIHNRTPDREEGGRFSPENNLAVIEVKGFWNLDKNGRIRDREKLQFMKDRYGYQYSFCLELKEDKGILSLV